MGFDFSRAAQPPEHWDRFVQLLRNGAPRMPVVATSARDRDLARANTAGTVVSAAGDGLNANIHPALGLAAGVATASDPRQAVNGVVDSTIGYSAARVFGGEAGGLVGGYLMLVRGFRQSLDRSDQMVAYLLGISGFITTLARCSVSAMRERTHHFVMPTPRVPGDIERMGDLYSPTRRAWFEAGYDVVARAVREIDGLRPSSGDHYSKRCLTHLGLQANMTGSEDCESWRMRNRLEEIIQRDILRIRLDQQREQLRRWAMEA